MIKTIKLDFAPMCDNDFKSLIETLAKYDLKIISMKADEQCPYSNIFKLSGRCANIKAYLFKEYAGCHESYEELISEIK